MNNATMVPLLEEIFHYENNPVLVLNTSCIIQSMNEKAARMLNLDKEEIGKPLPMDELSQSRWQSFLKKVRQESFSFSSFTIRGKDSLYKEIKVFGMFIKKDNLIFMKILNEEINKKFQISGKGFLDVLPYGLIFFKDNSAININSQAIKLLGINKEEFLNLTLESFLSRYGEYNYNEFLSKLKNFKHVVFNVSNRKNNEELFLNFNFKYLNSLGLIVLTIVDHSEIIKLRKKVKELEHLSEIGKLSATIAHEIRNLVTSLKGFVELLKGHTTDDGKNYIEIIESEMERMENILSEILYLSKPSQCFKEKVSLFNVIKEVIQIMEPQAYLNEVDIQLKIGEHCNSLIIGNANRLKQMFINLVKNAIEVMPNGGTVTIELKNVDDKIRVYVQDEGMGIPEEYLSELFTPFFTTKDEGTGLGLTLVKKVVDEHRGKIEVKSTVNVGSTFILEFPNYIENLSGFYYDNNHQIKNWLSSQEVDSIPLV